MTLAHRFVRAAVQACAGLVGLALLVAVPSSAEALRPTPAHAAKPMPQESQWQRDTKQVMKGSRAYVDKMLATHNGPLAINFDIDNSAMATYYRPGTATPAVLVFAQYAERHGVALMFNTARTGAPLKQARPLLTNAGYNVTELCGRHRGEKTPHSKQRCRRHFTKQGYTIIANVGNHSTDFSGRHDYHRAYHLPNYGMRLG